MSGKNTSGGSGGIGFLGLLGLLFIALKLCHVIAWSWWLVTLPLWGGLAALAAVCTVALPVVALVSLRGRRKRKRALSRQTAVRRGRDDG